MLRLLREADTGTHGGDRGNQYTGGKSDNVTLGKQDRGNSKAYTLDRLHRQNPELYDLVKRGTLSANAAAIQAGIRKPPPTTLDVLRRAWSLTF